MGIENNMENPFDKEPEFSDVGDQEGAQQEDPNSIRSTAQTKPVQPWINRAKERLQQFRDKFTSPKPEQQKTPEFEYKYTLSEGASQKANPDHAEICEDALNHTTFIKEVQKIDGTVEKQTIKRWIGIDGSGGSIKGPDKSERIQDAAINMSSAVLQTTLETPEEVLLKADEIGQLKEGYGTGLVADINQETGEVNVAHAGDFVALRWKPTGYVSKRHYEQSGPSKFQLLTEQHNLSERLRSLGLRKTVDLEGAGSESISRSIGYENKPLTLDQIDKTNIFLEDDEFLILMSDGGRVGDLLTDKSEYQNEVNEIMTKLYQGQTDTQEASKSITEAANKQAERARDDFDDISIVVIRREKTELPKKHEVQTTETVTVKETQEKPSWEGLVFKDSETLQERFAQHDIELSDIETQALVKLHLWDPALHVNILSNLVPLTEQDDFDSAANEIEEKVNQYRKKSGLTLILSDDELKNTFGENGLYLSGKDLATIHITPHDNPNNEVTEVLNQRGGPNLGENNILYSQVLNYVRERVNQDLSAKAAAEDEKEKVKGRRWNISLKEFAAKVGLRDERELATIGLRAIADINPRARVLLIALNLGTLAQKEARTLLKIRNAWTKVEKEIRKKLKENDNYEPSEDERIAYKQSLIDAGFGETSAEYLIDNGPRFLATLRYYYAQSLPGKAIDPFNEYYDELNLGGRLTAVGLGLATSAAGVAGAELARSKVDVQGASGVAAAMTYRGICNVVIPRVLDILTAKGAEKLKLFKSERQRQQWLDLTLRSSSWMTTTYATISLMGEQLEIVAQNIAQELAESSEISVSGQTLKDSGGLLSETPQVQIIDNQETATPHATGTPQATREGATSTQIAPETEQSAPAPSEHIEGGQPIGEMEVSGPYHFPQQEGDTIPDTGTGAEGAVEDTTGAETPPPPPIEAPTPPTSETGWKYVDTNRDGINDRIVFADIEGRFDTGSNYWEVEEVDGDEIITGGVLENGQHIALGARGGKIGSLQQELLSNHHGQDSSEAPWTPEEVAKAAFDAHAQGLELDEIEKPVEEVPVSQGIPGMQDELNKLYPDWSDHEVQVAAARAFAQGIRTDQLSDSEILAQVEALKPIETPPPAKVDHTTEDTSGGTWELDKNGNVVGAILPNEKQMSFEGTGVQPYQRAFADMREQGAPGPDDNLTPHEVGWLAQRAYLDKINLEDRSALQNYINEELPHYLEHHPEPLPDFANLEHGAGYDTDGDGENDSWWLVNDSGKVEAGRMGSEYDGKIMYLGDEGGLDGIVAEGIHNINQKLNPNQVAEISFRLVENKNLDIKYHDGEIKNFENIIGTQEQAVIDAANYDIARYSLQDFLRREFGLTPPEAKHVVWRQIGIEAPNILDKIYNQAPGDDVLNQLGVQLKVEDGIKAWNNRGWWEEWLKAHGYRK